MLAGSADLEMKLVTEIAGKFLRHPRQTNGLFEADSEILDLADRRFRYLVLKTDGISEEIEEKLYEDPHLIGWMAVTVTLSDVAATGAVAHGLLLNLQVPKQTSEDWLSRFQDGINAACMRYGLYVLGGDTNFARAVSVSTTAVATIDDGAPLTRKDIQAGDLLYATGPLGLGNAYAYSRYFDPRFSISYLPVARLQEGAWLKDCAAACIDTSDGLFPALSVLSELNKIGFALEGSLQDFLHDDARTISAEAAIPAWMLLAGPHGEYELLFAIRPGQREAFEKQFKTCSPVFLGRAIESKALQFDCGPRNISCEPSLIANLYRHSDGDVFRYFELLKRQHHEWSTS